MVEDQQVDVDLALHQMKRAGISCAAQRVETEPALIAALPASVKVVATFSVGYDHIDVACAAARGIAVCNTPDVLSVATAETAMLLILAAARRAGEGERLIRSGRWQGWAPTQLRAPAWSAGGWASSAWVASAANWRGWRGASA